MEIREFGKANSRKIVLIPGNMMSWRQFAKVIPLLEKDFHVIVAFAEEFVIRDACTYFLRDASWLLRYLLPNLFFALPHLFNYAGWGEISDEVLLTFLFSGLLGYIFSGCLLQLLKEKSGSIWLPVLLHCLIHMRRTPLL